MSPTTPITQAQAAEIAGVTLRHFKRLLKESDAPPQMTNAVGRANGIPCASFGDWLRKRYSAEIGATKDGEVYDKQVEHARLLHHQANIAALDEEVKKKTLIPEQVVLDRWQGILANVRARLLAVPSQLAATCADAPRQDVEQKAVELVRQALDELRNPEY
jgi:phage terminase Nu1 subunit (DNA packaging protein)